MILTVFTPVYNRAELIGRLYESLLAQTDKSFTWLVVDDGSADGLCEKIAEYQKNAPFEIRYVYKENGGKHTAHNLALSLCETELFFCVDSDDCLTENAVSRILAENEKQRGKGYLGYYFRKIDTSGNLSGGEVELGGSAVGLRDIYFTGKFSGELAIILNTERVRGFSFPVFDGEKFVSEKVFYNQISDIAPMYFIDEPIYVFEYMKDGYTMCAERLAAKNPRGAAAAYYSDALFGKRLMDRAKSYSAYLAIKRVFKTEAAEDGKRPPLSVRLLGRLLVWHYIPLFRSINQKYNAEK